MDGDGSDERALAWDWIGLDWTGPGVGAQVENLSGWWWVWIGGQGFDWLTGEAPGWSEQAFKSRRVGEMRWAERQICSQFHTVDD